MSDEIKTEEKECKCFCHSKAFKNFLTIALGTFVGVYCALCLFTALHKPPMMPPMGPRFGHMHGCPCHMMHHKHFEKMKRHGEFHKEIPNETGRQTPFEAPGTNAR
ncbi:hypothetical protein IJ750_05115 [bacterium]|nr:hypothetical protein [bacterium]